MALDKRRICPHQKITEFSTPRPYFSIIHHMVVQAKINTSIWKVPMHRRQHTSNAKKPPDLRTVADPSQRWNRWSVPSTPPSRASFGSCLLTSACNPGISLLGMYGGLLTNPVSLPLKSSSGSNQDPCLISTLS